MSPSNKLRASTPVIYAGDQPVITSGTTSTAVDLTGKTLVGLITPASLSSASLTFTVSDDNSTFRILKDKANTAYTVVVDSTSTQYYFEPTVFAGVRYIKIEAGSSETSKTFTLVSRPIS